MTHPIAKVINRQVAPSIYHMDMSLRPGSIRQELSTAGWHSAYLDGSRIYDKQSLLTEAAKALSFPDYFGMNWDAFEECITEPGFIEGDSFVLLYDHAAILYAQHPAEWKVFYDIMAQAVKYWSAQSVSFYLIVRNAGNVPQTLESL